MAKKLSMKVIKEDTKKYKEFIELPVGEDYIVKIYPYFSPTKVNQLMNELSSFYRSVKEEKVAVSDEEFDDIIGYFIVRHFTDITMTKSKKSKALYEEFNALKDSVLFKLIISAIPEESIESVYNSVFELIEFSSKFETKMKMVKEQMGNLQLNNPEVLRDKQIPEV